NAETASALSSRLAILPAVAKYVGGPEAEPDPETRDAKDHRQDHDLRSDQLGRVALPHEPGRGAAAGEREVRDDDGQLAERAHPLLHLLRYGPLAGTRMARVMGCRQLLVERGELLRELV